MCGGCKTCMRGGAGRDAVRYSIRPGTETEDYSEYGLGQRQLRGGGSQAHLSTQDSAKLAQAAYIYGDSAGTEEERHKNTDAAVASTGFKLLPRFSGRQMSVFAKQLPTGGVHLHIAHKGTQPSSLAGARDLLSDVRIAMGSAMGDSQFNERLRTSEKAVKSYNPQVLTMSGHSLGGATMNDSIVRSKLLRKRVDQADSFDAGASPFFSNTAAMFLGKKDKQKLADTMTHHRMRHDLVSKGLLYAKPPGDVVTYKLAAKDGEEWQDVNQQLGEPDHGGALLNKTKVREMGLAPRTLYAHHIDHFADRADLESSNVIYDKNRKKSTVQGSGDLSGGAPGDEGPLLKRARAADSERMWWEEPGPIRYVLFKRFDHTPESSNDPHGSKEGQPGRRDNNIIMTSPTTRPQIPPEARHQVDYQTFFANATDEYSLDSFVKMFGEKVEVVTPTPQIADQLFSRYEPMVYDTDGVLGGYGTGPAAEDSPPSKRAKRDSFGLAVGARPVTVVIRDRMYSATVEDHSSMYTEDDTSWDKAYINPGFAYGERGVHGADFHVTVTSIVPPDNDPNIVSKQFAMSVVAGGLRDLSELLQNMGGEIKVVLYNRQEAEQFAQRVRDLLPSYAAAEADY